MEHIPLETILEETLKRKASDLYLTVGNPPSLRIADRIEALGNTPLGEAEIREYLSAIIPEDKLRQFDTEWEFNSALNWKDRARFRVNVFRQQQCTGIVLRRVESHIPTIEDLQLPPVYKDLIMEKRGLILVVGPTGSGKSTSLAAMIGHRNRNGVGHIITIEDPIEFVHEHQGCIITQRDVGIDTHSFETALKNALRQRPDVVLIGEIRDRDAMEQAIVFAETGHLCLATLHANNANQTIERVINFFPEEKQKQVLINLSLNLKGILSQRLVPNRNGGRSLAIEIMLNRGLIKSQIEEGKIKELKELIEKGGHEGMQTFDQSLLDLYFSGVISEESALAESDNPANLRLAMKQKRMSGTAPTIAAAAPMQHFKL